VKVGGTKSFAAPRPLVWEVLNDPERMARLMPGVESFEVKDPAHWQANVKIPLGMGGIRMSFSFEKTDEREPEYARLRAKGNGVGAIVSMDTRFDLAEGGRGTEMKWQADVRIAGPVGSMGQRVLQPIVNQQVGNVLNALEKQVEEAGSRGEAPPKPESAPPAPETDGRGAEAGIHPGSPEAYSDEPEGPTQTTGD
jgi:carbon monoxide dehydrogenase subunit G